MSMCSPCLYELLRLYTLSISIRNWIYKIGYRNHWIKVDGEHLPGAKCPVLISVLFRSKLNFHCGWQHTEWCSSSWCTAKLYHHKLSFSFYYIFVCVCVCLHVSHKEKCKFSKHIFQYNKCFKKFTITSLKLSIFFGQKFWMVW